MEQSFSQTSVWSFSSTTSENHLNRRKDVIQCLNFFRLCNELLDFSSEKCDRPSKHRTTLTESMCGWTSTVVTRPANIAERLLNQMLTERISLTLMADILQSIIISNDFICWILLHSQNIMPVCILCLAQNNDNNVARYDCAFNRIQLRKYTQTHTFI